MEFWTFYSKDIPEQKIGSKHRNDEFRQKNDKTKTRTYVHIIKIGRGSTIGECSVLASKKNQALAVP